MKQKLFTLLTLALFFCSGAWAGEVTYTYFKVASSVLYGASAKSTSSPAVEGFVLDQVEFSLIDPSTSAVSVPSAGSGQLKIPASSAKGLVISAHGKTITKIEMSSWKNAPSGIKVGEETLTCTDGKVTWTGSATSVTFYNTEGSDRQFGTLTVTYDGDFLDGITSTTLSSLARSGYNENSIYSVNYSTSPTAYGLALNALNANSSMKLTNSTGKLTLKSIKPISSVVITWDNATDVTVGGVAITKDEENKKNTWTASNSTTTEVAFVNASTSGNHTPSSIAVTFATTDPTLTVSPSTQASGFAYETGAGPSAEQTYTVTGTNLSTTITATLSNTDAYEMRTGDNAYAAGPLSGLTSGTAVDVRLKAGLSAGDYNSNLTFSSTGADNKVVALTGTVSDPKTATVTTINSAGITNLDVKSGTAAGTLTASVTAGGSPVGGATVTWASSDESIVKVGETTGVVTLVAAGDAHITATYAGDETYAASFDDYAIEVIDTRKQVTLSFSTVSLNDYNYDGETLTAPTLTAKDQSDNTIDLAELPELSFAVDKEDVVTVNATTGVITAANTNNFGTSTVTVSFPGNSNYKSAASKSYTVTRAPMLYQVKFDNGFEAFIAEGDKTVSVYYMAGTSVPSQTGTIQIADGYSAEVVSNTVVLTKDTHTKTYDIVPTAVTPFEGAGKQTFDGTETYVASGYGWDNTKKWKFSKTDNDWTREAPGKTRLYFFVGAASSASFSFSTSRAVNIKVNGTNAGTDASSITLNANQANMIEIQSNQTSGDGGFKDMTLTGSKAAVSTAAGKTYATYVTSSALDFSAVSEDIKAYVAANTASEGSITFTGKDEVPAGTPLLIKTASAGATVYVPVIASADAVGTNYLVAGDGSAITYDDSDPNPANNHYYYILTNGQFKAANNSVVAVGKAYLSLPSAVSANELTINFDDEAGDVTGIATVSSKKLSNGEYYNLNGQRVDASHKGIVIVNGKKFFNK